MTAAKLDKLLPAAATAHAANIYRQELARNSEHVLLGVFHRAIKAGGADAILDSLRPQFDKHAEAIAVARSLINPESTAEQVIQSGQPELVTAWQQLDGHLRVISKIGAIAAQGRGSGISRRSVSTLPAKPSKPMIARSCAAQVRSRPTPRCSAGQTKATAPHRGHAAH